MTPGQIVTDIKTFLERGAELLETHMPGLVEHAEAFENDQLVQAAEAALHIPAEAKALAAELISKLAAMFPAPAPDGAEADPAPAE